MNITIVEPSAELMTPIEHMLQYPKLIEQAGRTCYKSEDKITAESSDRFIRSLIKRGHESVLEHCSITFRIVCSRACSHQLVRHRIGAYSQTSQRYCDYKDDWQFVMPWTVREHRGYKEYYIKTCEHLAGKYKQMREGIPPEDARFLLPNAIKTEVVTTYNIRQWRHVFRERLINEHAQWEIKQVMKSAYDVLMEYVPVFFEDLR